VQEVAEAQAISIELQLAKGIFTRLRSEELTTPSIQHLELVAGIAVVRSAIRRLGHCDNEQL
jgi:hypothetical protein